MENLRTIFFIINIGLIMYLVFVDRKETESTWAWILLLLNFPIPGFFLFTLIGQRAKRQKAYGSNGIGVLTEDNQVEVLLSGEEKFQAVFSDIKNAKKEILIQYYIFKDDFLFQNLRTLLTRKLEEGVKVKILYDSLGSRKISSKIWKELKEAGAEVRSFKHGIFRNLWSVISGFNYRNHRKIIVIDHHIGYLGGYNIGKE